MEKGIKTMFKKGLYFLKYEIDESSEGEHHHPGSSSTTRIDGGRDGRLEEALSLAVKNTLRDRPMEEEALRDE